MLGTPTVGSDNVWFHRNECFDDHVFDAVHDCVIVDPNLVEVLLQLSQIPFTCQVAASLSVLVCASTVFDIIITFLVYRVVSQMNVPFVCGFL